MNSEAEPRLTQLNPRQSLDDAVNLIIIVPSIGVTTDSYRDEWPCNDPRGWVQGIPARLNDSTALLFFEHGLKLTTLENWEQLIGSGKALIDLVKALKPVKNGLSRNVRLLFMSHGFGGFIVKSALNDLREDAALQFLFGTVAGLLFISCPHISPEDKVAWKRIPRILLVRTAEVPKKVADPAMLSCLATVCEAFDEHSQELRALVICESAKTMLQRSPVNESREQKLVDLELATLPSCRQEAVEVPAGHLRILQLQNHGRQLENAHCFLEDVLGRNGALNSSRGRRASAGHQNVPSITRLLNEEERVDPLQNIERLEQRQRSTAGRLQHHHDPSPTEPDPSAASGRRGEATTLQRGHRAGAFESEVFKAQRGLALPLYINNPSARVNDFGGREDLLKELETKLRKGAQELDTSPKGLLTVAIHGIGGIGKTSIAWAFVRRCEERKLYDFVLWIPADDRSKIVDALASAATALQLVNKYESQDQEYCARQLRIWLQEPVVALNARSDANTSEATWLLVFDNVDSLEMVTDFMPVSSHGSILFTTRDQIAASIELEVLDIAKQDSQTANNLEVGPFSVEESAKFMKSLAFHKNDDDQTIMKKIAEELDGIPLVLRQVANIMRRRKLSPATFWEMYQDQSTHKGLFKEKPGPQSAYYEHNISTVWGLSLLEHGEELMHVIAMLDPDQIAESIFHAARDVKDKSQLEGFPIDLERYTRAKEELYRSSLITDYEWQEIIRIHRVVQATVRSQMEPEVRRLTFNRATILLLQAWPESGEERGKVWKNNARDTWPECFKIRPHVTKLIQHWRSLQSEDVQNEISTLGFARLLIFSGWYDHDRGLSPNAETLFELAHQVCGRVHEVGDEIQAELHASQGAIATEMNQPDKCLHHYQHFFELTARRFGDPRNAEDRVNMAIAHNELGVARMMKGLVDGEDGAFQNFKKSRALLAEDIEGNDERALRAWGLASVNLAFACWGRGELRKGIKTIEDLLVMLDKDPEFRTKDSLVYGRAYHALGNLLETQGKFHDAHVHHQKAFDRHRYTLGEEHHRTADVAVRLAMHYCRTREFTESHRLLDVAEKVFTTKACYRPEKARCFHYRSRVLEKEGRSTDASEALDRAEGLFNEVLLEQESYEADRPIVTERFDKLVTFWSR